MEIYIMTRGYQNDYVFLGHTPKKTWWTEFDKWISPEYPNIVFVSHGGSGKLYLTAILSKRQDFRPRFIRYNLVIEDIQNVDCNKIFGILNCYIDDINVFSSNDKDVMQQSNSKLTEVFDNVFTKEYVETFFASAGKENESQKIKNYENEIEDKLKGIADTVPTETKVPEDDSFGNTFYWTCGLKHKDGKTKFLSFINYSLRSKNNCFAAYLKLMDENSVKELIEKIREKTETSIEVPVFLGKNIDDKINDGLGFCKHFIKEFKNTVKDIKTEFYNSLNKDDKNNISPDNNENTEQKYSKFGFLINGDSEFKKFKTEEKKTPNVIKTGSRYAIFAIFIFGCSLFFLSKTAPCISAIAFTLKSPSVLELQLTIENAFGSPSAESLNKDISIEKQSWDQNSQTLSVSVVHSNKEKEVPLQIINVKNRLGISMPPLKITIRNESFSSFYHL